MKAAAARSQVDSASVESEISSLLFKAIQLGDLEAVESLLAAGADVNAATKEGITPLMIAASFGQLAVLRLLKERGAAINKTRNDGFSALTLAVFFGHENIVRELLTWGANIDANSNRGQTTPEMWATVRGFSGIAGLLKESRKRNNMLPGSRFNDTPPPPKKGAESASAENALLKEADADMFFEEGIRKVGQTKWTTTPSADPVQRNGAAKNELKVTTDSRAQDDIPTRSSSLGEGIRRVGQTKWTTTDPVELTKYYPKVNGGSFSAFSTLSDRLGFTRTHWVLVFIVVLIVSAVGTIVLWKPFGVETQTVLENTAVTPPQSGTSKIETPDTSAPQVPVSGPSELTSSPTASSSIEDSVQSESAHPSPVQEVKASSADQTVGSPDAAQSLDSNRPKTTVLPNSNHRQKRSFRSGKQVEGVAETNEPAAITIVSEAPKEQVKTPTATPSQPATLIEGSAPKKKVIQWP